MKYLLGVLIRISLIPIFIILLIIGIMETVTTVLSVTLLGWFYRWLFKINYFNTPFDCTNILYDKLYQFSNKL